MSSMEIKDFKNAIRTFYCYKVIIDLGIISKTKVYAFEKELINSFRKDFFILNSSLSISAIPAPKCRFKDLVF